MEHSSSYDPEPCEGHSWSEGNCVSSVLTLCVILPIFTFTQIFAGLFKELVPEKLHEWAQYKGIDILGTGDFTHPLWLKELEEKLVPVEAGFFQLNPRYEIRNPKQSGKFRPVRFMLTAEVASIYSQGGKLRRIHTVLVAPSFEVVKKMNKELANLGNLTSDGRPILGLSAKGLAQIAFEADPTCLVIPAHAWTPWFSVFGSKSGFDSLAECYEELTPRSLQLKLAFHLIPR